MCFRMNYNPVENGVLQCPANHILVNLNNLNQFKSHLGSVALVVMDFNQCGHVCICLGMCLICLDMHLAYI